jgi:hypothetical protein
MKPKGLLIAIGLLAVLGGLTWWSNKTQKDPAKATDAAPKILTIPDDQFKEIKVQKTGGETLVLRKSDQNKWTIAEPKALPADQDSAGQVASALASLSADKLIDEKATDLAAYGLGAPSLSVTITRKDGKSDNLLFGDETPTGSGSYVKLASDARVFTVASFTRTSVDKTANDLRDKRLLTFDSDKLTRVELTAKGPAIEFGKNNQNDWQILKPRPLRADGSQVEDLVRKLKDAKMDPTVSYEDAKKAVAAFGAGAKVAVVAVADSAGTQTLEVRKDKDKNYYAKSSVVEGVFKVDAALGDGIDKAVDDFRQKKLFDFGFNDPTKVELKAATYAKSGDKWMAGPKQMDSASVQTLIDKLRDLTSIKFLEKGGGEEVFTATVTSSDGKRVEKVAISKQGDQYLGKRENEPSIYEIDGKLVEELQKAAGDIREAKPEAATKKK